MRNELPKAIGVFGTAKNTGKTTTLLALTQYTLNKGFRVGLTSIGYDGEHFDNITGLPKPRYYLYPGTIVATAKASLPEETSSFEIVQYTGIQSALGEIFIIRVLRAGYFILAGPTQTNYLSQILSLMRDFAVEYTFIDGALNRLVPMSAAHGVVMATGAARNTDLDKLKEETQAINEIFQMPSTKITQMPSEVTLERINSEIVTLPSKSLLVPGDLELIWKIIHADEIKRVYIPGFISLELMNTMLNDLSYNTEVILNDITRFLVSGSISEVSALYMKIQQKIKLSVFNKLGFYGITVNPYYPRYRFETGTYEPAYVDRETLFQKIVEASDLPVCDVYKSGCSSIIKQIGVSDK